MQMAVRHVVALVHLLGDRRGEILLLGIAALMIELLLGRPAIHLVVECLLRGR